MVSTRNPINTDDVRVRAAEKLSRFSARKKNRKANTITGDIVKPIYLSKSEPLVRRMTCFQKHNS